MLGISIEELSPARSAAFVSAPVRVLNGTEDRHTTASDAEVLLGAFRGEKHIQWFERPHTLIYSILIRRWTRPSSWNLYSSTLRRRLTRSWGGRVVRPRFSGAKARRCHAPVNAVLGV